MNKKLSKNPELVAKNPELVAKNPELAAKIDEAVKEEKRRASGDFDGLLGSFPEGTSVVLSNILSYLHEYLFDYKNLSEKEVRTLLAELETRQHEKKKGFRSRREPLDEGVTVTVGILNSIRSTLRVKGKQVIPRRPDGRPIYGRELTDDEAVRLLLSGRDGLRGARVRAGGRKRGTGVRVQQFVRVDRLRKKMDEIAAKHPEMNYRNLAESVAAELGCSERTVRRHIKNPRTRKPRDTTP